MSDLFTPSADWRRLPSRYATVRRLGALVSNLAATIVAGVAVGLLVDWRWAAGVAVVGLGWTGWRIVRAGRWVCAFGYAERDEDLLITQGLWNKHLTAIPYGRMLSVNVESGPVDRAWGLARVELVTASVQSAGRIPGLPQDEAAALRDRLIAAGEAQALPL
ncbi:MAG: PH domain-containing protein [Propionicimonas sp.]|uniref:PH domain-containing protein n=1 Tax=Propionicimonas sp. TaxID=1955623 RepID=UPI003D0C15C3